MSEKRDCENNCKFAIMIKRVQSDIDTLFTKTDRLAEDKISKKDVTLLLGLLTLIFIVVNFLFKHLK